MAKIISKKTGEEIEVTDGDEIKESCEKLGVLFGCKNGICGSCMIDILEGEENLSELTDKEELMECDEKHRLACQTKIKKGKLKIDF